MNFDYHVHSTYSDGGKMRRMVRAAEEMNVTQLGFADHANVSNRDIMKEYRNVLGLNLDLTYQRRRKAINELQKETEITLFDAVEMDYHPKDKETIEDFLRKAGFDYSIGGLHHLEDVNIHFQEYFKQITEDEQHQLVDRYFKMLVEMIETEIFDIAAHIDLIERNPAFRGKPTREHYEKVAEAFTNSKTVPEINGGRATYGLKEVHPLQNFQEVLESKGIKFTIGTDSHTPDELRSLTKKTRKEIEGRGLQTQRIF